MSLAPTLRKLLFGLGTAVFVLGALEGGLRAWGAWLRGSLARSDETPGEYLILAVGDSVTQGVPFHAPEAWPALLGQGLRDAGHMARVAPIAIAGAGWHHLDTLTEQWLAENPQEQPFTMIALAGHNDCAYLAGPGDPALAPPGQDDSGLRSWLGRLATYRALVQVVARARGQQAQDDYGDVAPPRVATDAGAHCRRQLSAGIGRFDALARAHGAALWVATYPEPAQATPHLARLNAAIRPTLVAEARARSLPVLDLSTCTHAEPDEAMFQRDGVHMTRSGYRKMAECMAAGLGMP